MRAIVTGGAGFIGSNLVDRLLSDGAQVLIIDDLSRGREANIASALSKGAELAQVDIRDGRALMKCFTAFAPDTVFHLAAQIDVHASKSAPAHDANVNVVGSINVFAAAEAVGVSRVVNTSTGGAIYGDTTSFPTAESVPARPVSAYGLGKRSAEMYAAWFTEAHDLNVVTLRYGNVYGPRQDPAGDAGVIAIFCDCLVRRRPPTLYGDGRQTRDFVYVGDIVNANVKAATAPVPPGAVYNVGTGVEVSLIELIAMLRDVAGIWGDDLKPIFGAALGGEVRRSCLDVRLAASELGFAAATPLRDGLRATFDWVRSCLISRGPTW